MITNIIDPAIVVMTILLVVYIIVAYTNDDRR